MDGAVMELPRYQCHKHVWALKIKEIRQSAAEVQHEGGSWEIVPEDENYGPIEVPHAYVTKHSPQAGGYYVVYEGEYRSFSPAEAFESGYTSTRKGEQFRGALREAINRHSMEAGSNTPDFILAVYLANCLEAFDRTMQVRERFYAPPETATKSDIKRTPDYKAGIA